MQWKRRGWQCCICASVLYVNVQVCYDCGSLLPDVVRSVLFYSRVMIQALPKCTITAHASTHTHICMCKSLKTKKKVCVFHVCVKIQCVYTVYR